MDLEHRNFISGSSLASFLSLTSMYQRNITAVYEIRGTEHDLSEKDDILTAAQDKTIGTIMIHKPKAIT